MTTAAVRNFLREYGQKAEIKGVRVSPHTFRHTFAIMFLRNGGNPFVLQRILGHSTLEMTQRYVNLLVEDLQREQAKFGPGDRFDF
ncbi:MAG: site-specific integrase [Peptococcaceae bacterium]|nr:site-specific integrase [Peptococcaceae bacterium]